MIWTPWVTGTATPWSSKRRWSNGCAISVPARGKNTQPFAYTAGTLLVNGSITSAVSVDSGATLGGTSGTIASTVSNNGTIGEFNHGVDD